MKGTQRSLDIERGKVKISGRLIAPGDWVMVDTPRYRREGRFRGLDPSGKLVVQLTFAQYASTLLHLKRSEVRVIEEANHAKQFPE